LLILTGKPAAALAGRSNQQHFESAGESPAKVIQIIRSIRFNRVVSQGGLAIKLDIVQVAYHVTDIRRAASDMAARFGAGPFFINENITLTWGDHRGEPTDFVHSSAYGQWGEVMVEFFTQESEAANTPYRDMYAADQEGLHHTAIMVDDMEEAFAYFERNDMPVVTRCGLGGGNAAHFAFIDARDSLGHMIEIYPRSEGLLSFYKRVRDASVGWNGEDPLRSV
jgi:catechol 2,3-dioxygenase-like lactoylglutathione lyase family enzyme